MQQSILPVFGTENPQKCPVSKDFCLIVSVSSLKNFPPTLVPRSSPSCAASTLVLPHLGTHRLAPVTERKPIVVWVLIDALTLCASPGISFHAHLFIYFSDMIPNLASSDVLHLPLISRNITLTSRMWI